MIRHPINADRQSSKRIITQDKALLGLLDMAKKIAPSAATVLVTGESGTGKELLASFIHANSNRTGEPYVAINCAALPEQLAESELFGHEKGAFTGAITRKIGKFESAENGTLVLDEITEMALPLQAKLLRALQEREIVRLGNNRPISISARVIADQQPKYEKGGHIRSIPRRSFLSAERHSFDDSTLAGTEKRHSPACRLFF
jgi:two-component system response regulator FlrC